MSEVITDAQRDALRRLSPVLPADVYLAGGVAVAVRIGHRRSRDLDFFTQTTNPESLVDVLAQLPDVSVTTRQHGTLHLVVGGVPVSIIRNAYPLLEPAERLADLDFAAASAADLTAMKIHAVAGRGARRDFWDLHELLRTRGVSLADALSEHARRYAIDDLGHVVRSLVYFGDAEAEPMPEGLTDAAWQHIRQDFARWVAALPVGGG
jgi:hypothetical protein